MQQGDIVIVKTKETDKGQYGIAYDSRLIIVTNWKGFKVLSLEALKLTRNFDIFVYRPKEILNNHRRTNFKKVLASMVAGLVPIRWKERKDFSIFLRKLYRQVSKNKIPDILSEDATILVERYNGGVQYGKTF